MGEWLTWWGTAAFYLGDRCVWFEPRCNRRPELYVDRYTHTD